MKIAIHQPNLFPWLGYFHKIFNSDIFVFLDDAQFPKKGANWINRNYLMINKMKRPITIAIDRNYHGYRTINEIKIKQYDEFKSKTEKTFLNYKKAKFFDETSNFLDKLFSNNYSYLSEFNKSFIISLCNRLNIQPKIKHAHELNLSNLSNKRLVSIIKTYSGNVYLCGNGSDGYLDVEYFNKHNIQVEFQQFNHPKYKQLSNDFISHLSILDCLFNEGFTKTEEIIKNA